MFRSIGQEGTAIDVAGCTSTDEDGSSILWSFCTKQLVQNGGRIIASYEQFFSAMGSFTYSGVLSGYGVGTIAGEVAVFDSQGPVVVYRSTP